MDAERPHPSRLAIIFVVLGLALSAIGIAYIMSPAERVLLPAPKAKVSAQQFHALFRMLTHSFFIFLAFLLGSYLMVRIGRRVLHTKPPGDRSEYVDAWSNYRLSQEEIDTASAGLDDDFPPEAAPGEEIP